MGAIEELRDLPWERLQQLYVGEKIGLAALTICVVLGCLAAVNRLLAGHITIPIPRSALKEPKKGGFGLKYLVWLVAAVVPGGLVGTYTIYVLLGKEKWRRDALHFVALSMLPAAGLMALRMPQFPYPDWRTMTPVEEILGVAFGVLQLLSTLRLLREWWGEADECVPWWPPLAFCLQTGLLLAVVVRVVMGPE